jgi:hypothetical protein
MTSSEPVSNGVSIGADGFLFLADGGHRVLHYASGDGVIPDQSFVNFEANIKNRLMLANSGGAGYRHVIVPDKQSVLPHLCPVPVARRLGQLYLERCDLPDVVEYPLALLEACDPPAYYRTDTHLTHAASILIVRKIAEELTGEDLEGASQEILENFKVSEDFCGDLGNKLEPAVTETVRVYDGRRWNDRWFHNNLIGGNNGITDLRFNLTARFDKRVLIFGDSFGRELAWFLSYFFSEVIFMRTPFFHPEIFDQMKPDFVLTENAERYLDFCPSDDERPSYFMFPYLSKGSYAPSREFAEAFSAMLSFPRPPYQKFRNSLARA